MNLKLWGESTQRFQKLSGTGPTFFTLHIHMASHRVLQYVAGAKTKPPTVYMRCHVKPGASKVREGITALTDSTIELCVSAVPKDGESNKAVLTVLSEVSPSHSKSRLGSHELTPGSGAQRPKVRSPNHPWCKVQG